MHICVCLICTSQPSIVFCTIELLALTMSVQEYLSLDMSCVLRVRHGLLVKKPQVNWALFVLAQYLLFCVLEIVDRNRCWLICLLVHTERNSPQRTEENAIFGVKFEELHRRISEIQRRFSYIFRSLAGVKIDVKKLTP
jgi:hypothetical protein